MKPLRHIFLLLLAAGLAPAAGYAQGNASASASQTIQLVLHPTLDISFMSTNSGTAAPVQMDFQSMAEYAEGITSANQELRVRSNKTFKISVQTDASNFVYSGAQPSAPGMPVDNLLLLAVTDNNTGGAVNSAFNNSYNSLSAASQDLVLNGQMGADQKLSVAYKAKPGFGYSAGTYTVGVLYTATQP